MKLSSKLRDKIRRPATEAFGLAMILEYTHRELDGETHRITEITKKSLLYRLDYTLGVSGKPHYSSVTLTIRRDKLGRIYVPTSY